MPNTPSNIDQAAIWAAAIEGLEIQKKRIEDQIAAVKSLLGGAAAPSAAPRRRGRPPGSKNVAAAPKKRGPKPGRKKRSLSPEARARIAEAQKKRWAEHNKKKAAK
jgi:hypothetical protein